MENKLTRGTIIKNEFEVIKLLGQGAYTSVYLIRSKKSNSLFALKVYQGPYQNNVAFQRRFKREYELSRGLDHPNLVSYKAAGVLEGSPYIIMEYINGKSVKDLIAYHRRIPVKIALPIFADALKALEYLHQFDIIHRDIKPSAIFVSSEGRVKLADLDVAKKFSANEVLTEKGVVIGSQLYMSPEQKMGGYTDLRTDVFSAGITFYEMITGKNPWTDSDFLPTDRRAWSQLELPSEVVIDASKSLDKFILGAIDLQPSRRYSSAKEMIYHLIETSDWKNGYATRSDIMKLASGERVSENDIAITQNQFNIEEKDELPKNVKDQVDDLYIRQSERRKVTQMLEEKEKELKQQQKMVTIAIAFGIVSLVVTIATLLITWLSNK